MLGKKIQDFITTTGKKSFLLGLSGGADSVFLFHQLAPLHKSGLIVLHCLHINHEWRDTAQRDEEFCKALCKAEAIPFTAEKAHRWYARISPAKQGTGSREADAREMRRVVFAHYQKVLAADVILLAHHADDQMETFFIRLIRGAGLTGLCSMQEHEDTIYRPLLSTRKKEILGWFEEQGKNYCYDETNDDLSFLRNKIRATLIPAFEASDARASNSLLRTIAHLQQEESLLEEITTAAIQGITAEPGWYRTTLLLNCQKALQIRIILALLIKQKEAFTPSESLFEEIIRFLRSPHGGTHVIGTDIAIEKRQKLFSFLRLPRRESV